MLYGDKYAVGAHKDYSYLYRFHQCAYTIAVVCLGVIPLRQFRIGKHLHNHPEPQMTEGMLCLQGIHR